VWAHFSECVATVQVSFALLCIYIYSIYMSVYIPVTWGVGEARGANATPMFFLPKNNFFGYWVEEGQIQTGVIVGERCTYINPLTPNDHYSGRTTTLTSKRCILYIYSTNIVTEYFKRGIYSPFFPLQNAVCSIILTYFVFGSCIIHILYTGCAKIKKIIPAPKRLSHNLPLHHIVVYDGQ